jgi:hypothetical protein
VRHVGIGTRYAAGAAEESLRSGQGILRLAQDFSPAELEAASERALLIKAYSYRALRTLMKTPVAPARSPALDLAHENVRCSKYVR